MTSDANLWETADRWVKGKGAMGDREWLGCWAVILLAVLLYSTVGCGESKCEPPSKLTEVGVCHIPDRSGGGTGGKSTIQGGVSLPLPDAGLEADARVSVGLPGGRGGHGGSTADAGSPDEPRAGRGSADLDAGRVLPERDAAESAESGGAGGGEPTAGKIAPPSVDAGTAPPMTAGMMAPLPPLPRCGDGHVDTGEVCDGDCTTQCNDNDLCTVDALTGSAATCDVVCRHSPITAAKGGDGCCPSGANATNDSDCKASCGNGVVETGELCDGQCPVACAQEDPCTTTKLTGKASTCNATCTKTPITTPKSGDGCCPPGAIKSEDSDCTITCIANADCESQGECWDVTCVGGGCAGKPRVGQPCANGGTCQGDGSCAGAANTRLYMNCVSSTDCGGAQCMDGVCRTTCTPGGSTKCQPATENPSHPVGCFITASGGGICVWMCAVDTDCQEAGQLCAGALGGSAPTGMCQ